MLKKIQTVFLYSLIFILQFNARYIFNFPEIKNLQSFHEQTTLSLFAFDLLFLLLAVVFIRYHSKRIVWGVFLKESLNSPLFYFVIYILLFIFWQKGNFYFTLRLLEAVILFIVAKTLFKQYTVAVYGKFIIFSAGVMQSVLAIIQVLTQKSIGLTFLGESIMSPSIYNVAKFEFAGEKYIRAYGTFPHPNLLAIFLLFALASGLGVLLLKEKTLASLKYRYRLIFYGELFLIISGIISTYSRIAIILMFVILGMFIFQQRQKINQAYLLFCQHFKIPFFLQTTLAILIVFGSIFTTYNILAPRLCVECINDNSLKLHQTYNSLAKNIIAKYPIFGVGPGNFVSIFKKNNVYHLNEWDIQPVHNFYLLAGSEIGLLGLLLLLLTVTFYFFRRTTIQTIISSPVKLFFLLCLLAGLFDHYFWTLPQGQLIFWLSLALATAPQLETIDSPKYHFKIILKNTRQLIKDLSQF